PYPGYEDRVEFNERTYSLTLKNLQKNDSGLYEARASNHKATVVTQYNLSVLDPVEDPVLTHQIIRDTCNITLTCRGHDLSINSSCYNETCEEKQTRHQPWRTSLSSLVCQGQLHSSVTIVKPSQLEGKCSGDGRT
ncbi:hypothetical protein NFI96_027815, partial [Prochilodus magdalenae]